MHRVTPVCTVASSRVHGRAPVRDVDAIIIIGPLP
jgi:hypothetical protein